MATLTSFPFEITSRDIPETEAIHNRIEEKIKKLGQFYHRIDSAKVVIDVPQKHKRQGKLFGINIEVNVPGKALVVSHKADEDLYVAIRDAFKAMVKQLESYAERQRAEVKTHAQPVGGRIQRLYHDYGFIRGLDGREFYFNADSLLNKRFDELYMGTAVRFVETIDRDGLRAVQVNLC